MVSYSLLIQSKRIQSYHAYFAGIFVSGGFLITFGQFVPSWDSAYYQLMMTQNIPYKGYLSSKWWLMVIATIVTTLVASFYLFWMANVFNCRWRIYNIGVNSQLVLLGGAYTKTPIDLSSGKEPLEIKALIQNHVNLHSTILPVLLYWLGSKYGNAK
jgi:hypothetical protein